MADNQGASSSTFSATNMSALSDNQLRQTISQLSSYASPTPQPAHSKTYMKNLHTWSTTTTPPPKTPAATTRSSRSRTARSSNLATTPQTQYVQPTYQPPMPITNLIQVPLPPPNPPRPPLPTTPQAVQSTYSSRLRTGATLLVQPILASTSVTGTRAATRRGGVINYADPGSGDDLPDAGALDSDDSDFVASGGTRTSIRQSRSRQTGGMSVFNPVTGVSSPHPSQPPKQEKAELDQSYLGMVPPARFIKSRPMPPTSHIYPTQEIMERHALNRSTLIPIRVEFETETHRVRDCFVWNLNETLIRPEMFAKTFCNDLDLPLTPWQETVANQIRAQIEEHEGVASMELGIDGAMDIDAAPPNGDETSECRVILSIDVQIANYHLMDHIEWDLLSPLTPEAFANKLCAEIGLGGEAVPLIAHALHEELMKHKKDAIEWGVIGGEREVGGYDAAAGERPARDRSGFGLMKDKTGLGLGWGRAPKDGRGPKSLKSVWRDWAEAEEFRTKFEVLSAEEVERREIEKERASRRLRRETSKFQTTRSSRRIRY
ncbi:Chromatin structure-remodeling complex subunit sfh1 [Hypsizygus marmoreus]|uniref:Chromatin structure-remodeling complex subunit sfh1 n=1 Tax=Hypsizygus marmoreus TaxID=39966 RepID=A0A369J7F6_HYPMA|nr:Chromatin structure-remodeling complex subunit sfh1 [Hypsizygus marmoreus]